MGGSVVTFCPTRLFWTKSTKMIHSSGVLESNLSNLIMFFPEVVSLGVLWHKWSIYSKSSSLLFSSQARGMIGLTNLLGWVYWLIWELVPQVSPFFLSHLAICGEVTLLCPMLKIGWHKTLVLQHSQRCLLLWVCWGLTLVACLEAVLVHCEQI